MQREIEFRVWHNFEKCWEEVLTEGKLCINHGSPLFRLPLEVCKRRYPNRPDRPIDHYPFATLSNIFGSPDFYSVQQYTGLKDQNGVKIFEGDIVAIPLFSWHNNQRRLIQAIPNIPELLEWSDDCSVKQFYSEFEIIGNIYENPELLNQ